MDNANKYKINTDIVVISGVRNPNGTLQTYTTPITSPLHPYYKEPNHDFGESRL